MQYVDGVGGEAQQEEDRSDLPRETYISSSHFPQLAPSPCSQKRLGPVSVRINCLGAEPLSRDFMCPHYTQHPHGPLALPGRLLHCRPIRRSPDLDNRVDQTSQPRGPLKSGPAGFPGLPAEASLFSLLSFT